jgi:tetratricopeptide (TPR) repeat protein
MLRADDYDTAMNYFKAALAEDPNDHRSAFAMGVTAELMGDWHAALKYYRRACAMPGLGEEEQAKYVAAKDRVASQKDRIKKNSNA